MTDTKQHHPQFGPSSIGRLMLCPSSVVRNPATDVSSSGPGAKRGTMLHEAALEGKTQDLSDFDQYAIDSYIAYVAEEMGKHSPTMGAGRLMEHLKEETFVIYSQEGEMLTFGTADEVALYTACGDGGAQFARIFDLKTHPTGVVPAYSTKFQGICYAIGAFQRWEDLEMVDFHAFAPYGPTSLHINLHREEVDYYLGMIETAIEKAQGALKGTVQVLNPGTEQCTYCPSLATCPATVGTVRSLVSADSGGLDEFLRAMNQKGDSMDPGALNKFFGRFELAKKTIEALGKLINRYAESETGLPEGCQLEVKSRKGRVSFKETPKNKSALPGRISKRLRVEDFQAAKTVSPAKLRDAFVRQYMKEKECDKAYALEVWELKMTELLDSKEDSKFIGWKKGAIKPLEDDTALKSILMAIDDLDGSLLTSRLKPALEGKPVD